jgi:hypothetical protein
MGASLSQGFAAALEISVDESASQAVNSRSPKGLRTFNHVVLHLTLGIGHENDGQFSASVQHVTLIAAY